VSGPIIVTIPVKTKNPLNGQTGNSRLAAIIRGRQRAEQRGLTKMLLLAALTPVREGLFGWPVKVTMTRLSAGKLDKRDGLSSALKGVQDGVTDALGLKDDSDETKVLFFDDQRKVRPGVYGVEVRVEPYRPPA
jgi:hypothetical protein